MYVRIFSRRDDNAPRPGCAVSLQLRLKDCSVIWIKYGRMYGTANGLAAIKKAGSVSPTGWMDLFRMHGY